MQSAKIKLRVHSMHFRRTIEAGAVIVGPVHA